MTRLGLASVCVYTYRLYTETKLAVFRLFELAILPVGWKANVWNTCRRRRRIRQRGFGFQSSFTKFCLQNEASFRPPRLTEGRVRLLIALQFIRPAISSSDLQVSSRLYNKWTRLSKAARTNKHVYNIINSMISDSHKLAKCEYNNDNAFTSNSFFFDI